MKAFYVTDTEAKVIDIADDDWRVYLDLIGCRCFDIANRKVGDTRFDIYCDDEGLFAENPRVSGARKMKNGKYEPMLVGNLVFTHTDEDGNTIGITDDDVKVIKENLFCGMSFGKVYPIVLMEY